MPVATPGQAHAVLVAHHGREVAQHHQLLLRRMAEAHKAVNRVGAVIDLEPGKAPRLVVARMQRGMAAVALVEGAHQALHARVVWLLEQVPVELAVMPPLLLLCQLGAHEQELAPGVGVHEGQQGAQVGALLPVVAPHLVVERTFAVGHLVVRQRQHVMLGVGVHHGKAQSVVVVGAVHRVAREVVQGVVHPAQVPLVMKTQATEPGRRRHAGERSGLFGHGDGAGHVLAQHAVEFAHKGDGFVVFSPAVAVGNPLAGAAAVVAVKHGGHGVHAQAVQAIALGPEQGAADQKIAHFAPAQVVDQGVPVAVHAFARVGVLIQRGAVKAGQRMFVRRKVCGHPVQQHLQAQRVRARHKAAQGGGLAITGRWGKQMGGLVAPGAVERVLVNGHEFQVGKAQVHHVGQQAVGQRVPLQPGTIGVAPGAHVHFVNAHGRVQGVGACARTGRAQHRSGQARHHAGAATTAFSAQGVGVGFEDAVAVHAGHGKLVERALLHLRHKQFPQTGVAPVAHGVMLRIPVVEVAHHRHLARVGRPHGKGGARLVSYTPGVGAELGPGSQVAPLGK